MNENACNLNLRRNPNINNQKELLTFSFLEPEMEAEITSNQILVTLPFQTNPTNLVSIFTHNSKQVLVNNIPQTSGITKNNFSSPVTYTLVAGDGSRSNYIISVFIPNTDGNIYVATLANSLRRFGTANLLSNLTPTSFDASSLFMLANELDQIRNILYVGLGATGQNTIHVYDSPNTNATTSRTFTITNMTRIAGIALDRTNNKMFVVNLDATTPNNTNRRIFRIDNPSNKSGTLTSGVDFRQIEAPDLHISSQGVRRIEYSSKTDSLYICDYGADRVYIYDKISDATHLSTLQKSRELSITKPTGVALDINKDILFIASDFNDEISIYDNANQLNSSSQPNRKINGPVFNNPFGISYIPELNRLYVVNSANNNVIYFNKARSISGNQTGTVSAFSATGPSDIAVDIYR